MGKWEGEKGVCPICEQYKILVVDHDHETGVIRGRICQSCNSRIGWMVVYAAAVERYLTNPPGMAGFRTYREFLKHYQARWKRIRYQNDPEYRARCNAAVARSAAKKKTA